MKRLLLVMLLAVAAHADDEPSRWHACRSNLPYQLRLRTLFHMERDTAVIRFVHEPNPWGRYDPPIDSESSVALFVPKHGDATIEFALALQSVSKSDGANVPVVFKRSQIDRSLALSLSRRLREELQPLHDDWVSICMDSCADHTVLLQDGDETICRSASGDASGADLDSTWTGLLAALLRKTAEGDTPRAENEAALKELISLRVVVPRYVDGPAPNVTP